MGELAEAAVTFALWFAVVLIAAKLGAELVERVFHQPAVVGELMAGVIIGPYALGGLDLPVLGTLFPTVGSGTAVPEDLWVIAQVAAVLLLFVAGLETDFAAFRRFGMAASAVAVGGVIVPFALGDLAAVVFGLAESPFEPTALFLGVVLTATSLGVTARLMSDLGKLDTPEGVTILGAAVLDDVLGVIVLALVVAITSTGVVEPLEIGLLGVQTVAVWLALTGLLLAGATLLARVMDRFITSGAVISLSLAVALLAGVVAESVGLAMIIGAYSAGLALSRSSLRVKLVNEMRTVQHVLVPLFFVTMGMLVDLRAVVPVLGMGVALTVLAMLGKVVGASIPARMAGFNSLGALRIGLGMMPRGEVALIVAGVGLATGVIDNAVFGVAVLVAVATTVAAPVFMKPAFKIDRSGYRSDGVPAGSRVVYVHADLPPGLAQALEQHLQASLEESGFEAVGTWDDLHGGNGVELQRGSDLVSLEARDEAHHRRSVRLESETPIDGMDRITQRAAEAGARELSEALMAGVRAQEA